VRETRRALMILCVLAGCAAIAPAQREEKPKPPQSHATRGTGTADPLPPLFEAQEYEQVAISPDGTKVAWVEAQKTKDGSRTGKSAIYAEDLTKNAAPERITAGTARAFFEEHELSWSPDSTRLAFLSDAGKPGQLQLYVAAVPQHVTQRAAYLDHLPEAGLRKMTSTKGLLATPRWSPDGRWIAVLHTPDATRAAGPLMPETPEHGEIKDAFFEQRLAVIESNSGDRLRDLTPDDTYIYEYDWTPDSQGFVLTAAKGNGDNNWWVAQLYTLNASSKEIHAIYKPKLQIARPVVSADGKTVAFIEGLMSDEDSVGGDAFTVSIGGGEARNVTLGRKASGSSLAWTRDGKIIDMENADGESSIARIDPRSGAIESLYHAPELLTAGFWSTSLSLTPNGMVSACARSSFSAPPEVWAGEIGKWKQVTRHNAELKPAWGEAKSIRWKNDGLDIQGWLIYPKDFDPSKKYPMVVAVHGGPGYAIQSSWPSVPFGNFMALPAKGYFLFQPNPRGSFGRGEEFTQANVRDFGYGDWRDVLAGVDAVLASAPVDPQRLGLTGWSYGGYMTMWGVTQTNRFRAAVAGAGIADWASYYGENSIDQWMIPFFGKSVYDDPDVYARSAPLTFIKNVKTPTLIIVGDSDGECPTPQSYEFWHALKTMGVETELVVYEREGHMFVKPADVRDVIKRMTNWFDAHLQ
jgi:dipeptidyl aminopeptidase/acylaminoacyl peptidase